MTPSFSPLWISLKTSACATALAFLFGVAAARALSRYRGRWRGVLDGVLILPLVLPPTVVGFFLLLLFGRRSPVGQALEQIGLPVVFSWPGTVVAATVVAFPLMYRTALGAFEQVSPNLLAAARTLGASEWLAFRRVLLPLAWPGVLAGTVLAFARALGEFGATLMLAGNIPGRTQTMPVAVFFAADTGDMALALRWAALLVAMSLSAVAALNAVAPRRRPAAARPPVELSACTPITVGPLAGAPAKSAELFVDIRKSFPGFSFSVSFEARRGVLGVLGASGSGKSMTLRTIAGLETPDEGRIVLNGRVLFDSSRGDCVPPASRRVGILFQDYALFPHLTVAENIGFGLHDRPPEERRERVAEWAALVGLDSLLGRYPGELSGGQRQRTALARALAMDPEVLLLDEPFSALDTHLRRQLEEQLREILGRYHGVTVFVTHDRNEAYRMSEELLVLEEGHVAAAAPKQALFANPETVAVARLTGCKNLAPIRRAGEARIHIADWNCALDLARTVPDSAAYAGIRAHHLRFAEDGAARNTFPCWLVGSTDSPFEATLYLRIGSAPGPGDRPHLEAEISQEEWARRKNIPQPWHLHIDEHSLLLLK